MRASTDSARNRRRDSRGRYKGFPYANKKSDRTFRNRQLRRTELADIAGGGIWAKTHKRRVTWDAW